VTLGNLFSTLNSHILSNLKANLGFVTNYNTNLVNKTYYNQFLLGGQLKAIYNFKRIGIGLRYIRYFTPELELKNFKGYNHIIGITTTIKIK
jgi:hypothetical protein